MRDTGKTAEDVSVAELAAEATGRLFCDGSSNAAQRLVIEQLDGRDGGGYCRAAVESHFREAIQRGRNIPIDELDANVLHIVFARALEAHSVASAGYAEVLRVREVVFRRCGLSDGGTSPPPVPTCCRRHWEEATGRHAMVVAAALWNPVGMPMIVCQICGNKRCPHATDCGLDCTGSNEPGQAGSIYG